MISIRDITLIVASVLAFILLWQLRSLLLILMVAVVLAASIAPIVNYGERWKVPRFLSVILVYLGLIAGLVGVALIIGPTAFEQIERLIRKTPLFLSATVDAVETWVMSQSDARPELVSQIFDLLDVQGLSGWAIRSTQNLLLRSFSLTTGIVGGAISLVLSVFLSGYILSDSRTLIRGATSLFPQPWDERLAEQIGPMSQRMGSYIRGRVLVSAILGVIITTTLGFLGLSEYALGLGAIAAITNLVPFLGPILGAVPAILLAIPNGPWTLLWVLVLFVVVQNLETYVLDPLLVGSSVGIHPLYQLLAVLGGSQVLGIIGALIVPPWVAGSGVLLENLYLKPKLAAEQQSTMELPAADPDPAVVPRLSSQ